jgi:hypothetical protein
VVSKGGAVPTAASPPTPGISWSRTVTRRRRGGIADRPSRTGTVLLLAAALAAGVLLVMRAPSSVSAQDGLAESWRSDLDAVLAEGGVHLLGEFRSAGEQPCLVFSQGGEADPAGVAMLRRMPTAPPAREWWVLYMPRDEESRRGLGAFPPQWHLDPALRASWRAHPGVKALPIPGSGEFPVQQGIAQWRLRASAAAAGL